MNYVYIAQTTQLLETLQSHIVRELSSHSADNSAFGLHNYVVLKLLPQCKDDLNAGEAMQIAIETCKCDRYMQASFINTNLRLLFQFKRSKKSGGI